MSIDDFIIGVLVVIVVVQAGDNQYKTGKSLLQSTSCVEIFVDIVRCRRLSTRT